MLTHYSPVDFNPELKVVAKANQYINPNHINNIAKQMAIKYGELIRQNKFKIKVFANVRHIKDHEDEPIEEVNQLIGIDVINILTRIEINDLDFSIALDNERLRRDMLGSGWNLQGINHLKIYFHKTNDINGRTYIKIPIRSNAILNIQNIDTYCFLWSILANMHPVDKIHNGLVTMNHI